MSRAIPGPRRQPLTICAADGTVRRSSRKHWQRDMAVAPRHGRGPSECFKCGNPLSVSLTICAADGSPKIFYIGRAGRHPTRHWPRDTAGAPANESLKKSCQRELRLLLHFDLVILPSCELDEEQLPISHAQLITVHCNLTKTPAATGPDLLKVHASGEIQCAVRS